MTAWTDDELRRIGEATELQLASRRPDGTLRPYVTMWVVRAGDDIYVRSAGGPDRPWYRRATASGLGRVRAGGVERDVAFESAPPDAHAALDAAYHSKYDGYGPQIVGSVVGPDAHRVTVRLVPRTDDD
jgi:hypothetical protein